MIGSNHFNHSQERLHCDYVTNILKKEMILGIPDQVIVYNFISMLPQSYRHYPTYLIRAVVTSIILREVLLYLIMYHSFYSVINGINVLQTKRKIIFLFIYIDSSFIYTIYIRNSSSYFHKVLFTIPISVI